MKILVYGDLIIDETITGEVNRVSPEAPCMVVLHQSTRRTLGGAANVAANIAAMMPRAAVRFFSAQQVPFVGNDRADNLIVTGLSSAPAPVKQRIVSRDHQLLRLDIEDPTRVNSEAILGEEYLRRILNTTYDAVVIADYRKGACFEAIIEQIIRYAEDAVIPVFVDAKPGGPADVAGLYDRATLRKWNRLEAQVPKDDWLAARRRVREIADERGDQGTVITLDGDGVVWCAYGSCSELPAERVDAIDPTGAGDTFLAGLVTAFFDIDQGEDDPADPGLWFGSVMQFANKAAARAVSTRGTAVIDGIL